VELPGAGHVVSARLCAEAAIGHPARRSWAELKAKTRRINSESYNLMLGQKNAAEVLA
jgi:hypothetical protein